MITFAPFATMSPLLEVRSPELGDHESVSLNTIRTRVMMDGSMVTHKFTPAIERLKLTFESLSRRKVLEIRAFLLSTAGQELRYIDFNGVSWRGKLLTNPAELATVGKGPGKDGERKEDNHVILEFEGARV